MELLEIVRSCGITDAPLRICPFLREEDETEYEAWKVSAGDRDYVLKKAKERELSVYAGFFSGDIQGAPRLLANTRWEDQDYFLMEYVQGRDLTRCDRNSLRLALDALIALQDRFWADRNHDGAGVSFAESREGRRRRGKYLNDPVLEQAYGKFLSLYEDLPRTLCHDDLLPFNVLVSADRATIIDWECAGMLPYPTSLARLLAHGTEDEDAFFYMTDGDRAFAIDYYYDRLLREKGISYADYRRTLDYFLLYEYCEWIMLGNRYPDANMERFHFYLEKARAHVAKRGLA